MQKLASEKFLSRNHINIHIQPQTHRNANFNNFNTNHTYNSKNNTANYQLKSS